MSVIGEGTYGCVHKPSLKCDNKKISYTDKISKLILNDDANIEVAEYSNISKVDKSKKYYTGPPIKCQLKYDKNTLKSIKKCKQSSKILSSILDYSLLILKYGGINLTTFVDKMNREQVTRANTNKMNKFWKEARRLFEGIAVFDANRLIHHDVKPDNIVYSQDTNRVNFIDFGLMQKSDTVYKACTKSNYWMASKMHWSFPFEIMYLEKNKYMGFVKMSDYDKRVMFDDIVDSLDNDNNYISNTIKVFYSTIITSRNTVNEQHDMKVKLFDDYKTLLLDEMKSTNYTEFLKKSMHTIDSYGLGMTLMNMLNNTRHLIDPALYARLNALFYNMIRPNVFKRYDITRSKAEYDAVITSGSGLHHGRANPSLENTLSKSNLLLSRANRARIQTRYTLKRRTK